MEDKQESLKHKERDGPNGYLGYRNLTQDQIKSLTVVKERLKKEIAESDRWSDWRIIRFLRARAWNVENSIQMIREDMQWRKERHVDNILETFPQKPYFKAVMQSWPGAFHGVDKDNHRVWFERVGTVDPKHLLKQFTEEELIEFHIYLMETGEQRLMDEAKSTGEPPIGNSIVQDLAGLGWKHLYAPGLGAIKKCITIDSAHYPERLKYMFVVNVPSIFTVFWKILKPWIDPVTLNKVRILGSDYLSELQQHIDSKHMPDYLGGGCTACSGGCVSTAAASAEQGSHEIVVAAGAKHEERVTVDKAGTSIGWEFKSEGYDVGFTVYYEEAPSKLVAVHERETCAPDTLIQGRVVATEVGAYILEWDNSYSYMTKKNVTYQVFVDAPTEHVTHTPKSKKKKKKSKSKKN